jgi:hypothetical protein
MKITITKLEIEVQYDRVLTLRRSHLKDPILIVSIVVVIFYYLGTEVRINGQTEEEKNKT